MRPSPAHDAACVLLREKSLRNLDVQKYAQAGDQHGDGERDRKLMRQAPTSGMRRVGGEQPVEKPLTRSVEDIALFRF